VLPEDLFRAAQVEVLMLLQRDKMGAFLASAYWAECVNSAERRQALFEQ
jgi:hypothetical protein